MCLKCFIRLASRRGGNTEGTSPTKNMQAAQVLKSHREAVESHEKRKDDEHRRHEGEDDGEKTDPELEEEEEILIEVPKYLQGIPLVDGHTEKLGEVGFHV